MSSWELQLVETAEEELGILRTQYPDRFAYLKSDLQSFISHLREDHAPPVPSSAIVLTQESSNCQSKQKHKKRKCISNNIRSQSSSSSSSTSSSSSSSTSSFHKNYKKMDVRREDRSEMVLKRAQICLHKIRQLKASLSSSFTN